MVVGGHEMQMMAFQNTLQPIIDKLWLHEDFAQHLKWLLKHQERKEMWKCHSILVFPAALNGEEHNIKTH